MSQDDVNHPSHYTQYLGLEIIELTRQMMFSPGNAVKCIARAGLKDKAREIEDLKKAVWYVQDEIKRLPDSTRMNSYDKLELVLAHQMNHNRGSAVKAICLGDTKSLNDALGYLRMEIEGLEYRQKYQTIPRIVKKGRAAMIQDQAVGIAGELSENLGNAVKYIAIPCTDEQTDIDNLEKALVHIKDEVRSVQPPTGRHHDADWVEKIYALSDQMNAHRREAIEWICISGSKLSLRIAVGLIEREIGEMKRTLGHPAFPETDITGEQA